MVEGAHHEYRVEGLGLPGLDISGKTMQRYFDEASGGRVSFEPGPAGVVAWPFLSNSSAGVIRFEAADENLPFMYDDYAAALKAYVAAGGHLLLEVSRGGPVRPSEAVQCPVQGSQRRPGVVGPALDHHRPGRTGQRGQSARVEPSG